MNKTTTQLFKRFQQIMIQKIKVGTTIEMNINSYEKQKQFYKRLHPNCSIK